LPIAHGPLWPNARWALAGPMTLALSGAMHNGINQISFRETTLNLIMKLNLIMICLSERMEQVEGNK
jgi:hypothetical protein